MISNEPETRPKFFAIEEVRAIDGDTIEARIILAFGQSLTARIRLQDWYAPELDGPGAAAGERAKVALSSWLEGRKLFLFCPRAGKDLHGRVVAHLWWNGRIVPGQEVLGGFQLTKERHATLKSAMRKSEEGPRMRAFMSLSNDELQLLISTMDNWDNPMKWQALQEAEERELPKVVLSGPRPPPGTGSESPPPSLT